MRTFFIYVKFGVTGIFCFEAEGVKGVREKSLSVDAKYGVKNEEVDLFDCLPTLGEGDYWNWLLDLRLVFLTKACFNKFGYISDGK